MPRTASSIQTEIDQVDAALAKAYEAQSYSTAGRSKTNQSIDSLTKRRDLLQQQLDRVTGAAPMIVRTYVDGLH